MLEYSFFLFSNLKCCNSIFVLFFFLFSNVKFFFIVQSVMNLDFSVLLVFDFFEDVIS